MPGRNMRHPNTTVPLATTAAPASAAKAPPRPPWGGANQTGWWTYIVLWSMRLSAKLNLFLGVHNLSESFLPTHLRYLQTYFTRRACNWLMPFSVIAGTAGTIETEYLNHTADAPGADPRREGVVLGTRV